MKQKLFVCSAFVLFVGSVFYVSPVEAQELATLTACLSDPMPAVRESCIRNGLQSKEAIVRSTALFAAFENRRVLILEIEEPDIIINARKKVNEGEVYYRVLPSETLQESYYFFDKINGQIAFQDLDYDKQNAQFSFTVFDASLQLSDTKRHNKGVGLISGDSVQIKMAVTVPSKITAQCNFSGRLQSQQEIRGAMACTGLPIIRTQARIVLY